MFRSKTAPTAQFPPVITSLKRTLSPKISWDSWILKEMIKKEAWIIRVKSTSIARTILQLSSSQNQPKRKQWTQKTCLTHWTWATRKIKRNKFHAMRGNRRTTSAIPFTYLCLCKSSMRALLMKIIILTPIKVSRSQTFPIAIQCLFRPKTKWVGFSKIPDSSQWGLMRKLEVLLIG